MNRNFRYFAAVFVLVVAGVMLWAAAARAQRGGPVSPTAPPTVVAYCDPCTVDLGKTASVHAYARDPNHRQLKIHWTAKAGTFADPSGRQTVWTAPTQEGPVDLSVAVDNGNGGTASSTITIAVRSSQQQ